MSTGSEQSQGRGCQALSKTLLQPNTKLSTPPYSSSSFHNRSGQQLNTIGGPQYNNTSGGSQVAGNTILGDVNICKDLHTWVP